MSVKLLCLIKLVAKRYILCKECSFFCLEDIYIEKDRERKTERQRNRERQRERDRERQRCGYLKTKIKKCQKYETLLTTIYTPELKTLAVTLH